MFRTSSRSISGPSRRHGPSLTRGAASLRQFHHRSALCSKVNNKPAGVSNGSADVLPSKSSKKVPIRYIQSNSKLPSESPGLTSKPQEQRRLGSSTAKPQKNDAQTRKKIRQEMQQLRKSAQQHQKDFEEAKNAASKKDLANPNKKAKLLKLLDAALASTRMLHQPVSAVAEEMHRTARETETKLKHRVIGTTEADLQDHRDAAKKCDQLVKEVEDQIENLQKQREALFPDASPDVSTKTGPKSGPEKNKLSFGSKQNIVAQILESSSRNAPALPLADTEARIERLKRDGTKETLGHIAKHVETKTCGELSSKALGLTALDAPMAPVPGVSFGLDRVLFNPGVYHLRDPRSRVYNFDPYLGQIMPITEFDFSALKPYITSSKDVTALEMTAKHNKKYYGSSSSMTSALSHFHYLLSAWRPVDTRNISQGFGESMRSFTRLLRAPIAMFVHYKEKEDAYAIDADKEFDSANILMNLGKSMEKLLTLPKEEFERYGRSSENKITPEEEESVPESYHYTTAGKFLMRSQLDAYDPRLPGTGMFDLKTRAVVSIRMDAANHEGGMGYEIKDRFGNYESYEREYFDMIRAAFLKYSLQVRVGRMDGIFVAYHNIERIFGFQYISLPEMDQSLHGQSDTALGDKEFELSLGLWEQILDRATAKFPKQSLRFHFETRDAVTPFMYIFAQPVTQDQIHAIQTKNQAEVEAIQERLFNPGQPISKVMDIGDYVAPEDAPEGSSPAELSEEQVEAATEDPDYDENLLAMTLITRSTVNGQPVDRPVNFRARDEWRVSYEINELNPKQGNVLLKMCKKRRAGVLDKSDDDNNSSDNTSFFERLKRLAEEGRRFRQKENRKDLDHGVVIYEEPKKSV